MPSFWLEQLTRRMLVTLSEMSITGVWNKIFRSDYILLEFEVPERHQEEVLKIRT